MAQKIVAVQLSKKNLNLLAMKMQVLSFGMIKPDATKRNIHWDMIKDIQNAGFFIAAIDPPMLLKPEAVAKHYAAHKEKPFYPKLIGQIQSGLVLPFIVAKHNCVPEFRALMGATNPRDADPKSIRGKYAMDINRTSIHGSDSPEGAFSEIGLHFPGAQIYLPRSLAEPLLDGLQ